MNAPVLCIAATPALQRTLEFDRLERGGVNRARSTSVSPAGKAVNVALVLRALGAPAMLTGFLGGATGGQMRELLDARGVENDFVPTVLPTRVATTIIEDTPRKKITELVEEASAPLDDEWRMLFQKYRDQLRAAAMVIIAGALPPGAPVDVYAALARLAREAGKPLLIDSQKQPLLSALAHGPLLAKLNRDELATTLVREIRSRAALAEAARELVRRGAAWVLVTDGARTAHLVGAETMISFAPPKIEALNAVGSGDATTAGIAAALLAGEDMPQAVTLGLACGAANALTLTPADVNPAKARELRDQVRVLK